MYFHNRASHKGLFAMGFHSRKTPVASTSFSPHPYPNVALILNCIYIGSLDPVLQTLLVWIAKQTTLGLFCLHDDTLIYRIFLSSFGIWGNVFREACLLSMKALEYGKLCRVSGKLGWKKWWNQAAKAIAHRQSWIQGPHILLARKSLTFVLTRNSRLVRLLVLN